MVSRELSRNSLENLVESSSKIQLELPREFCVYASALGCIPDPTLRYYADADGLEVDAVLELPDG